MTPFEKIVTVRNIYTLTVSQKMVLLTIATHLGNNESTNVGLTLLQKESCLTRANTVINLNKLIELGYVIKVAPSSASKSNQYFIDFKKITGISENGTTSIGAIPPREETELVSEQYHTSIAAIPPRYRSNTRLVSEQYPKEQLNKKEITIKKNNNRKKTSVIKKKDDELGTVMPWELFDEYQGVKELTQHEEVELGESEIGETMFWEMFGEQRLENESTQK